ncbi:MAG: sulfate adenylyltransferase subunit CysD [Betaproteobacteria bacterium]
MPESTQSAEIPHGFETPGQVWRSETAYQALIDQGLAGSEKAAQRRLSALGWLPPLLTQSDLRDEQGRHLNQVVLDWALEKARKQRRLVLFCQQTTFPDGRTLLHANDARGTRYWTWVAPTQASLADQSAPDLAIRQLQSHLNRPLTLLPHADLLPWARAIAPLDGIEIPLAAYPAVLEIAAPLAPVMRTTPHLKRLEAESIHIIREAVAEADNPVMLYSVGKDSSVMLHLARKAFHPAPPPFPLLHVDTRWKFQEMYLFREHMANVSGMDLLVHVNPEAIARDINPFDHGSAMHTDITKTEGLKQALDQHRFDVVFGGARRDEEKSRAKERIFSFRSQTHRWDPKQQRPELWDLYNTRKHRGESIRVFPLSNWTELDIWQYIYQEQIPVVPLYFAKKRPVVERNGMLLMIDDGRFRLLPGEEIQERLVRFRTLGCYPLTGAIESPATSLPEIILELINARSSERQGRAIDSDASASMEKKKKEGYF